MQVAQKFACQGVSRSTWLLKVSLLNLTLSNNNKGLILLPVCLPCPTPSLLLAPFSSPHFFQCSSSQWCQKRGKMCNIQKNQIYWHRCWFQQWLICIVALRELTFIAHYKTISSNSRGVQWSVLPIRGHLAWKFVTVIYRQACPRARTHR